MNAFVLALLLLQGTGSIDGTVVRAGSSDPLPQAQIVIAPVEGPLRDSRVATADAEGRFQFAGLAAGSYRLFFEHEGFVRGEYGQRSPGKPGLPIEVASGRNVSGIRQSLTAESVVHGRVVNASNDPLPNATVQLLSPTYRDGTRSLRAVQSVQTNDLGEYRLFGLIPGSYFLSATPAASPSIQANQINSPAGIGTAISPLQRNLSAGNFIDPRALDGGTDVTVYLPGTTDAGAAVAIALEPGISFRAPDLRTVRVRSFAIRGEIVDETGQPATVEVVTLTRMDSGALSFGVFPTSRANRTFEFSGLLPGRYEVAAADSGTIAQKTGHLHVAVEDQNSENLKLVLHPVFQIKGRIVQEEPSAGPASLRVELRGSGRFGSLQATPNAADGTFTLMRVTADSYRLAFSGMSNNIFVRSARYGGTDVLNSTLRIDGEPTDTLEIVLSRKTGSLEAVVLGRDQKPSTATTVVLVPEPAQRHRFDLYRTATTDNAGRTIVSGVAPGRYKVFAWTDIEANAWQNADVIRQYEERGRAVTIGENERATAAVPAIE